MDKLQNVIMAKFTRRNTVKYIFNQSILVNLL